MVTLVHAFWCFEASELICDFEWLFVTNGLLFLYNNRNIKSLISLFYSTCNLRVLETRVDLRLTSWFVFSTSTCSDDFRLWSFVLSSDVFVAYGLLFLFSKRNVKSLISLLYSICNLRILETRVDWDLRADLCFPVFFFVAFGLLYSYSDKDTRSLLTLLYGNFSSCIVGVDLSLWSFQVTFLSHTVNYIHIQIRLLGLSHLYCMVTLGRVFWWFEALEPICAFKCVFVANNLLFRYGKRNIKSLISLLYNTCNLPIPGTRVDSYELICVFQFYFCRVRFIILILWQGD